MFRMLTLPFRMIHTIRKLVWNVIWHFVYFFLRKPIRILYLVVVMLAGTWLLPSGHSSPSPPPPALEPIKPALKQENQVVSSLPPIKGHIRNVNSAFSQSSLDTMADMERQNYYKHFYHAMTHAQPNTPYLWQVTDNYFGSLEIQAPFKAKSGILCRFYKEQLSYRGSNESFDGLACQRRSGGWCRLRPQSAHTCELGKPSQMDLFFNKLF